MRVKKAVQPKNRSVFDFMICLPNDESEVINSPLLTISETEMRRCPNINNVTTDAEFKLIETLLQEANIEGYSLSYSSENFPDKFPLSCFSLSYYPICD